MKNRENTLRVLLDTSFILPTLGIRVGSEIEECLKRLREINAEIHYSIFSILESIWIATNLMEESEFDFDRFKLGLRSVIEAKKYKRVTEDTEVFIKAFNLYNMGHVDIIDNILYADSIYFDLKLLTVDSELRKFIRDKGLKDTIMFPSQVQKMNL